MAKTRLERLFPSGEPAVATEEYRRSRLKRLREITAIARRYKAHKGLTPVQLRNMLEDLGPTFVKIGQLLSMRSEILPPGHRAELTKLRADVSPIPYDVILQTLATNYSVPLSQIFSEIDEEPHGSASVAQVHRAKLVDGSDVAVKVIRPGVLDVMEEDISILRSLAKTATIFTSADEVIDIAGVVDELWVTFQEETDFLSEAQNLKDFAENNRDVAYISCPHVYDDLTTRSVLVMEYIDGISLSDTHLLLEAGYSLEEIGEKLVGNYTKQVLDDGFFHADPHPGNIFIRDGQIVYIDLGMMGRLTGRNRIALGNIIRAVGERDIPGLKAALLQFSVNKDTSKIDHARFLGDLDDIVEEFGTVDLKELDIGAFLTDLFSLAQRNFCELPTAASTIAKGFVTLEGVLDECLPQTNIIEIITSHLTSRETPEQMLAREMKELGLSGKVALNKSLQALGYASEITEMLTRGQLKLNMEAIGSEEPLSKLSNMVNRATLGLITAGLFIGSSIVYTSGIKPLIFGIPILGFLGYLGAAILSVWIVVDIWRKSRNR